MNKRSAMMVAAGLVLALLVAGMAVATGFTGPEAAAGRSGVSVPKVDRREPKVRTITETITVHRDAKPSDQVAPPPVVITQTPAAPASTASTAPTSYDDDGYEDEDHEDEDHEDEDEDHEDEDEDHEDEDD